MSLATHASLPPLLIQPKQLAGLLRSARPPRILDATWFLQMPGQPPRNAHAEFLRGPRIPGALFWDVDRVATVGEQVRHLPHMMPSAQVFAQAAGAHGITPDTHVVVYVFLPIVFRLMQAFGHKAISLLDGGLPAWADAGEPLDEVVLDRDPVTTPSTYPAPMQRDGWVRSFEEMLANTSLGARAQIVLDARGKARFDGHTPEPRAGLASGHIPGAHSLPFTEVLEEHTAQDPRLKGHTYTTMRQQHELWKIVSAAVGGADGIEKLRHDGSSPGALGVSLTCGSGMTASILWLVLQQLGVNAAIYDESWMGWGRRAAEGMAPVETTPPAE